LQLEGSRCDRWRSPLASPIPCQHHHFSEFTIHTGASHTRGSVHAHTLTTPLSVEATELRVDLTKMTLTPDCVAGAKCPTARRRCHTLVAEAWPDPCVMRMKSVKKGVEQKTCVFSFVSRCDFTQHRTATWSTHTLPFASSYSFCRACRDGVCERDR